MNKYERLLKEEARRMDKIVAPESFEVRLKDALQNVPTKQAKWEGWNWKLAMIMLIVLIIIGSQYNTLAFYGKKMLGFDEVISGSLKKLNDEGMGQIINKKITLAEGIELTIDGVMTDKDEMTMYYTLRRPGGFTDFDSDLFKPSRMAGFLTNSHRMGGVLVINDDFTEIKGVDTFHPVSPFAKKLTVDYTQELHDGRVVDGQVTFPYQPNKAMETMIKQKIKKTVNVDQGVITFDTIRASSLSTVIKGKIDVKNFDRTNTGLSGVALIANGSPVELTGSSSKSRLLNQTNFEVRFDGLPHELDSLKLVVKDFVGYDVLEEKIPLGMNKKEAFKLGDKNLWIKEVSSTPEGLRITVATDENVLLDGVAVLIGEASIPLETTVNQQYLDQKDGRVISERTLLFDTKEEPEFLFINGMHYEEIYNQYIEIPID